MKLEAHGQSGILQYCCGCVQYAARTPECTVRPTEDREKRRRPIFVEAIGPKTSTHISRLFYCVGYTIRDPTTSQDDAADALSLRAEDAVGRLSPNWQTMIRQLD